MVISGLGMIGFEDFKNRVWSFRAFRKIFGLGQRLRERLRERRERVG